MQQTPFDIPEQMRRAANEGIERARQALDQIMEATRQSVARAEGSVKSLREGTADVQRQAMAFVEENVAASFDYVEKLARAKSVEEIASLQQEYLKRQMQAAAEQGKSLGEMVGRAASEAVGRVRP